VGLILEFGKQAYIFLISKYFKRNIYALLLRYIGSYIRELLKDLHTKVWLSYLTFLRNWSRLGVGNVPEL
jgi:hypothetical protein